jgi:hypothetical protein
MSLSNMANRLRDLDDREAALATAREAVGREPKEQLLAPVAAGLAELPSDGTGDPPGDDRT